MYMYVMCRSFKILFCILLILAEDILSLKVVSQECAYMDPKKTSSLKYVNHKNYQNEDLESCFQGSLVGKIILNV